MNGAGLKNWRKLTDPQAVIIAALIAAVPSTLAAFSAFRAGQSSTESTIPVDIQPAVPLAVLFGTNPNTGQPRARMLGAKENEQLLGQRFAMAQKDIRIVTITGSSWLLANHVKRFENALSRVDVELLMLDFKDDDLYSLVQESVIANGQEMLDKGHYANYLRQYAVYLTSENKFTLGVQRSYPWTRFTIFDGSAASGAAVSFIITPAIAGGPSAQAYFTEDPLLVSCFKELYKRIRSEGVVFRDQQDAHAYARVAQ